MEVTLTLSKYLYYLKNEDRDTLKNNFQNFTIENGIYESHYIQYEDPDKFVKALFDIIVSYSAKHSNTLKLKVYCSLKAYNNLMASIHQYTILNGISFINNVEENVSEELF